MAVMVAATDLRTPASVRPRLAGIRGTASPGPDRIAVMLFSLAAFLVVLALLASQLRGPVRHSTVRAQVVSRRIYRTTVIETVPGRGSGISVAQSTSSSGSGYVPSAAPTTRSS
jgi:hypothetical protein